MKNKRFVVLAIMSAYNEGDIIYHIMGDLISQGVSIYLINHSSTDNTVEEASRWLSKGLVQIENFPEDSGYSGDNKSKFIWGDILRRKEELASTLEADWFIHHDADEFRESPWPNTTLNEAIEAVDALGYNAIDFELLNFRPIDNSFVPGSDVRKYLTYYEYGEQFNNKQIKAWKKQASMVDLVLTGGHEVLFEERRVFPIKFLLRHYPIRSQSHGEMKVFCERRGRYDSAELDKGWHIQYDKIRSDNCFLYDRSSLQCYEENLVRVGLLKSSIDLVMPANIYEKTNLKTEHVSRLENIIRELEKQLNSIYQSRAWRVMEKYYKIRDVLLKKK